MFERNQRVTFFEVFILKNENFWVLLAAAGHVGGSVERQVRCSAEQEPSRSADVAATVKAAYGALKALGDFTGVQVNSQRSSALVSGE